MRTMDRYHLRDVANGKITSRLRQVVTLIVAIIVGMIISIGAEAQHAYHKNKERHFKAKLKTQKHQYTNACAILDRKRTSGINRKSWGEKNVGVSFRPLKRTKVE